MLDAAPIPAHQRVRGAASVTLSDGPDARLLRLAQSGSAKAILPRMHGAAPEVVFLNTAGGLTSGDRLDYALAIGRGAVACGTTQTAERAYRADGPPARVTVLLEAGAGARLAWLPQETILYDGAGLDRETTVHLAGDAALLIAETLVLGRRASGETVARLALRDRRRVLRDGRPVWLDPLHLDSAALAGPGLAVLNGARAITTLAFVSPGAEDALGPVRAELGRHGVTAAASAWDGRLVMRAMAGDAAPLRRLLDRLVPLLRRAPCPRVWQN